MPSRCQPSLLLTSLSRPWVSLQPSLSHSPFPLSWLLTRSASSGSRWKQRQGRDSYARDAKVQGLKSRAAFKLLEMDAKYRLFKKGQTVVDLGYAPGSWSQVAIERTRPDGRVIGIDLLPAQPPRGVATFQGDFLSPVVQKLVKDYIRESHRRQPPPSPPESPEPVPPESDSAVHDSPGGTAIDQPSYIDSERQTALSQRPVPALADDSSAMRLVDIVLSDMSAPWDQTSGFNVNSLSNPYRRLMNTSGVSFRDHAGSMDLCTAALQFASDTLRPGGHLVCKFYQGSEDKALEKQLRKLFTKVHREKPESSRSESKESYFIALRRKAEAVVDTNDGTEPSSDNY